MHDPDTLAFEFKVPLPRWLFYTADDRRRLRNPKTRAHVMDPRPVLFRVWHHDPQRDGSDDSCGYTVPKLTQVQRDKLKWIAWEEARNPYFLRRNAREWTGSREEAEVMFRGLLLLIARSLGIRMGFDEAARVASIRMHTPDAINPAKLFVFQHGYHTNALPTPDLMGNQTGTAASFEISPERDHYLREEHMLGIVCQIARWDVLLERRPWWRRPRWHVHHWRVYVPLWQRLRRALFTRCAKCGKRMGWSTDVIGTWGGDTVWHGRCDGSYARVASPVVPGGDIESPVPPRNPLPTEDL